jgi:uncharacterized iron-regulated protein
MKKLLLPLVVAVMAVSFKGGDKPAYQLYTSNGAKTSYQELLAQAEKADIVLFGEYHNNPICHWLQLELTRDLHKKWGSNMALGAEMFEADNQNGLNMYLNGTVADTGLRRVVRLWPNYETDYRPLVDFAKDNKLPFIATNVPRKYANKVYMGGLESLETLPDSTKRWIAPLPIAYDSTLQCYRDIFMNAGGHGGQNLPKSQALKDATMSHFILQNWAPGSHFIHYNGSYHSDNRQGIAWYLLQKNPKLKILVISTTEQDDIGKFNAEDKGRGDFIISIPSAMTKTH